MLYSILFQEYKDVSQLNNEYSVTDFLPYLVLKPLFILLIKLSMLLTNEKGETSIIQCYF